MRWDNYPGGGPVYKQNKTDTALLTYTVTQTCVIPDCDDPCVGGTRMIQLSCPWSQSKESLPRDPGWLRHCPRPPPGLTMPESYECAPAWSSRGRRKNNFYNSAERRELGDNISLQSSNFTFHCQQHAKKYMVRDRLCKANVLIW